MPDGSADSHICCPACRCRGGYRLADGRRKCVRCGKRFAPRVLRCRLSAHAGRQLALYFWHMVPAAQAARELQLNRKTVQHHYRRLRQAMGGLGRFGADVTARSTALALGTPKDLVHVGKVSFGAEVGMAGVRILAWAEHREGEARSPLGKPDRALIVPRSAQALQSRDLDDFYLVFAEGEVREGEQNRVDELMNFWSFAKSLAKRYQGRQRQELGLFLQEMAFRFNYRHDPGVITLLLRWLQRGVG